MTRKLNPATLGAFVVGALALAIATLLVLGGGNLFRDKARMVVYFENSVVGLKVGAPVRFRGIDIGTVNDIRINIAGVARSPEAARIPVVIDIDQKLLDEKGAVGVDLHDRARVQQLVSDGLRAQLASESLVTGVRYIALDFHPKTPAYLVHDARVSYPEIPSLPTGLEQASDKIDKLLANLATIDLAGLVTSMQTTLDDAHHLLGSPEIGRTVQGLDRLTAGLSRSVQTIEKATGQLSPTLAAGKRAANAADTLFSPDGALASRIDAATREIEQAARSIKRLADQLTRDPGSLVRGGRP